MNYINVCYCADEVYAEHLPETISYLTKFYRDERELRVSLITNQDIYIPGVETIKIPWKRSIAQPSSSIYQDTRIKPVETPSSTG